jgi:hypothetical protein
MSRASLLSPTDWPLSCGRARSLPRSPQPRRLDWPRPAAVGSSGWLDGRLQPATNRSLVGQVLGRESRLQVTLLSRNDDERHERHGDEEREEQAETVDPQRDPELEEGEGQIDGVSAETVGTGVHDGGSGTVARDGRARRV